MASMTYEGRLSGEPAREGTLAIGTRIYNHGDMANIEHFGVVTQVEISEWGTNYEITPDADSDRTEPYWIPADMVSPEYKGNGLTRFVTEQEYHRYQAEQMAQFKKSGRSPGWRA